MKNLKRQVRLGDMEYLTGQAFSIAGIKKLLINESTTMLLHCSDNLTAGTDTIEEGSTPCAQSTLGS